jgi:hypothetical protein
MYFSIKLFAKLCVKFSDCHDIAKKVNLNAKFSDIISENNSLNCYESSPNYYENSSNY